MILQRSQQIPKLPKDLVRPTIVAGVNALGRGQDQQSLTTFISTIAQTMGPEMIAKFLNPEEYIKRLAAAQGIDYLNLIKTQEQIQQEQQAQQEQQMNMEMMKAAPQAMKSPLMDPTKNPSLMEGEVPEGGEGEAQLPPAPPE